MKELRHHLGARTFLSAATCDRLEALKKPKSGNVWKLLRTRMSALRAPTLVIGLAAIFFAQTLLAQQPERKLEPARFRAVDIYLDSKSTPLAAYQLEFTVTNVVTRIVGIEGGEPGAFGEPPFYDPKAMQHERVILAAFSTASSDKLPKGQVRVATIHIRTEGSEEPQVELKIQTAADAAGKPILVEANYQERKG